MAYIKKSIYNKNIFSCQPIIYVKEKDSKFFCILENWTSVRTVYEKLNPFHIHGYEVLMQDTTTRTYELGTIKFDYGNMGLEKPFKVKIWT